MERTTPRSQSIAAAILAAGLSVSAVVGTYRITERDGVREVVDPPPPVEVTDGRKGALADAWDRAAPEGPLRCRPSGERCLCVDGRQAGVLLDPAALGGSCDTDLEVRGGRVWTGRVRDEAKVEERGR